MYYKVFTSDLKSLGLRNNPNILQFDPHQWYMLYGDDIIPGKSDFGGIWVCSALGSANKLTKYMMEKHNIETRTFIVDIDQILYRNSYRLKINGIYLKEEIKIKKSLYRLYFYVW